MKTFFDFLEEAKGKEVERPLPLEYHHQLNPLLWKGKKLDERVRKALLRIGTAWGVFAKIPSKAISDIIMIGGNANYNYTRFSDIDVHLIVDMNQIISDSSLRDEWLYDKKILWAKYHPDIKVKGYPVELFAQDKKQPIRKDQGVYSLQKDKWLVPPSIHDVTRLYSNPLLRQKISFYSSQIDSLTNSKVSRSPEKIKEIKKLKEKFWKLRNTGLAHGGEFSTENLLYKVLRNTGKLDELDKMLRKAEDKSYSI